MIRFENISKQYKGKYAVERINFWVKKGHFVAIIGASGSGKTTLLKMINRLIKPTSGSIYIDGQNINEIDEVSLRRKLGYVMRQTGLFPHMTVAENIELMPKLERISSEKIYENTRQLMEMVGMSYGEYADCYPVELNEEQLKRVSIARALSLDPDIVLMDGPFLGLDPMTRSKLQDLLIDIQAKLKKTIVFVTDDMDEAIKVADEICVMKEGKILQYDLPENILKDPINELVSDFVGKNRIWSSPEYIKIIDIMVEKPVTAAKDFSILQCIDQMRQNKVDTLLIVEEDQKLVGIVKGNDLRGIEDKTQTAEAFMSKNFPTLFPDHCILDALKIVNEHYASPVPVVDPEFRLLGLITRSTLVAALSQQYFDYGEEEKAWTSGHILQQIIYKS